MFSQQSNIHKEFKNDEKKRFRAECADTKWFWLLLSDGKHSSQAPLEEKFLHNKVSNKLTENYFIAFSEDWPFKVVNI